MSSSSSLRVPVLDVDADHEESKTNCDADMSRITVRDITD